MPENIKKMKDLKTKNLHRNPELPAVGALLGLRSSRAACCTGVDLDIL